MSYKFNVSDQEAARLSGLDRSVLRKWVLSPSKGKVACSLVRGGVITFEEYKDLKDGRNKFYNNMLLAFLNIAHALKSEDVAQLIGISTKTIGTLSDGTASDTTKKALFYVCDKKFAIDSAEELYNGSFDRKGSK